MTDEQFAAIINDFQADIQTQFAIVNGTLGDLRRLIQANTDELRQRIGTAETTMINELRDLSARFSAVEARMTRLESR